MLAISQWRSPKLTQLTWNKSAANALLATRVLSNQKKTGNSYPEDRFKATQN